MKITVTNRQGASEVYRFPCVRNMMTQRDINAWFRRTWLDRENLTVVISEDSGEMVASKPFDRKSIYWFGQPGGHVS